MSWSECCRCVMTFSAACQRHMMVQYFCDSGSSNKLYCMYFILYQEANEVILNVCLFSLIYLQAGTRKEPYWVINAKPTYCRSLQTLD